MLIDMMVAMRAVSRDSFMANLTSMDEKDLSTCWGFVNMAGEEKINRKNNSIKMIERKAVVFIMLGNLSQLLDYGVWCMGFRFIKRGVVAVFPPYLLYLG
mgnify:CR=1 FL=1